MKIFIILIIIIATLLVSMILLSLSLFLCLPLGVRTQDLTAQSTNTKRVFELIDLELNQIEETSTIFHRSMKNWEY